MHSLVWQTGFKVKIVIFMKNMGIRGWIGCKMLLFNDLFLLIDIAQLFESINISKRLYFLLSVKSRSILSINLEALITCVLFAYASCWYQSCICLF